MKVCYHTVRWGWGNASQRLPEIFKEISTAGYKAVEISDLDISAYFSRPADFIKLLSQNELELVGVDKFGLRALILGRFDPYRFYTSRQVDKVMKFAGNVGCEKFVLAGPAVSSARVSVSKAEFKRFADSLNKIGKKCRKYQMRASYHPIEASIGSTVTQISELLELTDPELVNLTLDTGHLAVAGADLLELIDAFSKRIDLIHLKDVKGGIFTELGEGADIDVPALIRKLYSINYSGWVAIEDEVEANPKPLSLIGKTTKQPLETATNSKTYIENILSELRNQ